MTKKLLNILTALIMVVSLAGVLPAVDVAAAGGVKQKLDSFISTQPSRWTGSFDDGKECYGFAKLVIYNIFGKSNSGGYTYRTWKYNGSPTSGMTVIGYIKNYSATNVKNLLSKAKCGDVLQFDQTKQHSMIVYKVESDGVVIYDCNWDHNCGIRKKKCSFGTWSGRNSNRLTLLRSDNYSKIDGTTNTVDKSYEKNITAFDNLSTSKYAKTYVLKSSGTTIPYTSKNLSTRGTVTYGKSSSAYISNKSDELYVFDVGQKNGKYWAYVSYPISSSKRAYAYIPLSAITANNGSHVKKTSKGKFYCSIRSGSSTNSSYYVAKKDVVYLIATSGSKYQIMYPMASGKYRIAWCSKTDYNKYC